MKSLAERLEAAATGVDRNDHFDIDAHVALLREAAELARRVEGAETILCWPLRDQFHAVRILTLREYAGQRVRLVPIDTATGEGEGS